ncbi:MAG: hypothetical protein MJB57_11975, partial [Gemmatimonadetes bacterium]|nr:hypothetical protein [Gemmatimonadota bacterium]
GLAGLALLLTDHIPVPLGLPRVAAGIALYVAVGFGLARWNPERPTAWALAPAWALGTLGTVGLIDAFTGPAGDPTLAALLLLGPIASAYAGARWARRASRRPLRARAPRRSRS